jgi:hypothetical protein
MPVLETGAIRRSARRALCVRRLISLDIAHRPCRMMFRSGRSLMTFDSAGSMLPRTTVTNPSEAQKR